jgi:dTDP-4-amino-4,6-dideoxygalactose transaminase
MNDQPIPLFDVRLTDEDLRAVEETLRSGWLTMGPRTSEFERLYAEHLGVKHAVALANCTAALHLAYLAAGVGSGDEVIVPAITFVASAAAVRYCGGTPVLADVQGPHDLSIDPADAERRITERTKAICVVHYGGYLGPVEELTRICDERGIALIEDSAHNPSASPAGLAGCFSFFSNKVLGCGEGGLLATGDDEVAELVRSLRSHAMTSGTWDRHRGHQLTYDVTGVGYNYRLDELRAALLISRMQGLEDDIRRRRELVHRYRGLLAGVDGLIVPYTDDEVDTSACYVMPLVLEEPAYQEPLRGILRERWKVQTSLLYPAIGDFSAYRQLSPEPLPRSEAIARSQVTIPLYPHLAEADQDRVVRAVTESLAELSASPVR